MTQFSAPEIEFANLIFESASPQKNRLTSQAAAEVLTKSRVPIEMLHEFWEIACVGHSKDYIEPKQFAIILRMVAHCQSNMAFFLDCNQQTLRDSMNTLKERAPPQFAFIDGLTPEPAPPVNLAPPVFEQPINPTEILKVVQQVNQQNLQKAKTKKKALGPEAFALPEDMKKRYIQKFHTMDGDAGFVRGTAAKTLFDSSRLPARTLGKIWDLCDTGHRGLVSLPEFVVCMHLITLFKKHPDREVPTTLAPILKAYIEAESKDKPACDDVSLGQLKTFFTSNEGLHFNKNLIHKLGASDSKTTEALEEECLKIETQTADLIRQREALANQMPSQKRKYQEVAHREEELKQALAHLSAQLEEKRKEYEGVLQAHLNDEADGRDVNLLVKLRDKKGDRLESQRRQLRILNDIYEKQRTCFEAAATLRKSFSKKVKASLENLQELERENAKTKMELAKMERVR